MAVKISTVALILLGAWSGNRAGAAQTEAPDGPYTPRATVLVVKEDLLPEDLAVIEGAAVGLMNPGLGEVGAEQTWLDASQGARAFDTKYDAPLNTMFISSPYVLGWEKTLERAESADSNIRPGLLASALERGGQSSVAADLRGGRSLPALLAVDRSGRLRAAPDRCPGPHARSRSSSPPSAFRRPRDFPAGVIAAS